ncbi:MAG: HEAT repeat domain-containing protein [Oscillospiraceae bacterium]|nr:HEAT repeat domain-containing protein [Oscillospiraceae bacterium]
MDISKFYALKDRLYQSAAAGTAAVSEDFRLKRAVDEFEAEAAGSKAYLRLSQLCRKLLSDCTPSLLADCIALADAMTVVQGTFSDNSESEKSSFVCDDDISLNIPYSEIMPYREYVKTGGSSLENAVHNLKGGDINSDPRIISAFISSFKKSSMPHTAEVLRYYYGKKIIPLIKNTLDLNDPKTKGHAVSFVRRLARENENEWYISLYENADNPPEIRAAAVRALSCDMSNTERLINIYKTEKAKLKNAALYALGELDPPEADVIWQKLADKYKDSSENYFIASKSRICTEYIRKELDGAIYDYKNSSDSEKSRRIFTLRKMLVNKADTDDIYLKLMEAGFSEEELNNILIANLLNENNKPYRDQILRLLPENDFFRRTGVVFGILANPDLFFLQLSEHLSPSESMELKYIGDIKWCAALEHYMLCLTIPHVAGTNDSPVIFSPVSEKFPQSMLDFVADKRFFKSVEDIDRVRRKPLGQLTAEKKIGGKDILINFYRNAYNLAGSLCHTLIGLYESCSPEDSGRIRKAAVDFAEYVCGICPCYSSIRILTENKDISSPHAFVGLLERHTAYVLEHMDHNIRYRAWSSMVNMFPMTNEEKLSELNKALAAADNICKDKNDRLYGGISMEIKLSVEAMKKTISTGV